MDAVVQLDEAVDATCGIRGFVLPPRLMPFDVLDPVDEMLTMRRAPVGVILEQVLQRRQRPLLVEGHARLWERAEEDSAFTQHAVNLHQCPAGILDVLEHMTRDDEVEAAVRDGGEILGGSNVVDIHEVQTGELRILGPELFRRHAVDVLRVRPRRERQRLVQRAELDALALQPAGKANAFG